MLSKEIREFFIDFAFAYFEFSDEQIKEIELGLLNNVNMTFVNPYMTVEEIRQIRTKKPKKIRLVLQR